MGKILVEPGGLAIDCAYEKFYFPRERITIRIKRSIVPYLLVVHDLPTIPENVFFQTFRIRSLEVALRASAYKIEYF